MVALFPNWIVKHIRYPNLKTSSWLQRPVEVFLVSPKMTKMEIKEYLRKLYNLPVTAVHTANYLRKFRNDPQTGRKLKDAEYKKAYVYLRDKDGAQRPRYWRVEDQLREDAQKAWPAKPDRVVPSIKRVERSTWGGRSYEAQASSASE
uniref:Large ribosomal subunit protein uL23m n=1 Tax=Prymnesium polylepis TaxID=72548 RepID=A0A6T7YB62_9EUKA|mmetsp:Transcript_9906/g.26365  ORF Transcript_9906/g.26365 Transcript_9906/m.26365 type:complete len:148 (-) Transcript_9906:308-751(-)